MEVWWNILLMIKLYDRSGMFIPRGYPLSSILSYLLWILLCSSLISLFCIVIPCWILQNKIKNRTTVYSYSTVKNTGDALKTLLKIVYNKHWKQPGFFLSDAGQVLSLPNLGQEIGTGNQIVAEVFFTQHKVIVTWLFSCKKRVSTLC